MLSIFSQVLLACITGQTSIPIKIALVPYHINVLQNGHSAKLSISRALQIAQAVGDLLASGKTAVEVTVGSQSYILELVKD